MENSQIASKIIFILLAINRHLHNLRIVVFMPKLCSNTSLVLRLSVKLRCSYEEPHLIL
jgi:hypothetical protein